MVSLEAEVKDILHTNPVLIALSRIPESVESLISDHEKDLLEAWKVAEEDMITINFTVKIGIENGKKVGRVGISFTKEKVKGSADFLWEDSPQLSLLKK